MSDIRVINIKKSGNRIDYEYNINGECSKYFNLEEKFFVEYDFNVEDIPNGIAIIPFLCNILPISWIFNATITVDEIDSDFYYSDNEGHIFVKLKNNGDKECTIREGDNVVQGVFLEYGITIDDEVTGIRNGGFGSTTKNK